MALRQNASTGEMVDDQQPDPSQANTSSKNSDLNVKVYAPFKVYYEGKGLSVSAVNETGPFDILPHHHNFLCMLSPCNLVIKTGPGPDDSKTIKIGRALMHVREGKVTVFVDV